MPADGAATTAGSAAPTPDNPTAAAEGALPVARMAPGGPALLVDRVSCQVVRANRSALDLAPGLALPAAADAFFDAAGVGADGRELATGLRGPLPSRFPAPRQPLDRPGAAVAGPPVLLVAQPMDDAYGLAGHTLVLLPAPIPGATTVSGSSGQVVAGTCFYSLADAGDPGLPLVWVSPTLQAITGYSADEALARSWRLLAGSGTDQDAAAQLDRQAPPDDVAVTLLSYRKDGTAFWNRVCPTALLDGQGTVTHVLYVQTDVTESVNGERGRAAAEQAQERAEQAQERAEQAQERAEQAQERAEQAQERAEQAQRTAERAQRFTERAHAEARTLSRHLSVVAEATGLLGATLDVDESLDRLARLVVPLLADWVVINLADDHGRLGPSAIVRHRDGHHDALNRYRRLVPAGVSPGSPLHEVLAGGPPLLVAQFQAPSPEALSETERDIRELSLLFGSSSLIFVPLKARSRVLGTMMLVHGPSSRSFTVADLDLAADLGRRAGLAVDNARLYTREHQTALALQRGLLPELPDVAGLALAASYVPAGQDSQVGGDWWDVLSLPDGTTGLAIGDVMGHGLSAAAAMGQLRSVLRTCAWAGDRPATVLERMDQLVQNFSMAQLATCIYARLERIDGGSGRRRLPRLSWSNAGHLPPVCMTPDGRARLLTNAPGVPIGVPLAEPRHHDSVSLPHGTTLLLYTDGLVETRAGDIDSDLARLLAQVATHRPDDGPTALVERLHDEQTERTDDVAMLAVQLL